jgi:hypothetical protein
MRTGTGQDNTLKGVLSVQSSAGDMSRRVLDKLSSGEGRQVQQRLLSVKQAAQYMGISFWTMRDYVLAGHIPIVELWPLRPREGERPKQTLHRVLIDRVELDRLIELRKRQSPGVLTNG